MVLHGIRGINIATAIIISQREFICHAMTDGRRRVSAAFAPRRRPCRRRRRRLRCRARVLGAVVCRGGPGAIDKFVCLGKDVIVHKHLSARKQTLVKHCPRAMRTSSKCYFMASRTNILFVTHKDYGNVWRAQMCADAHERIEHKYIKCKCVNTLWRLEYAHRTPNR